MSDVRNRTSRSMRRVEPIRPSAPTGCLRRRGLLALCPRLLAETRGHRWLVDASGGSAHELTL
jgi:hypothetical protein